MQLDPMKLSVSVDLRLASSANWLAGRDLVEVARWGHWMSEAVVAKEVVKVPVLVQVEMKGEAPLDNALAYANEVGVL